MADPTHCSICEEPLAGYEWQQGLDGKGTHTHCLEALEADDEEEE